MIQDVLSLPSFRLSSQTPQVKNDPRQIREKGLLSADGAPELRLQAWFWQEGERGGGVRGAESGAGSREGGSGRGEARRRVNRQWGQGWAGKGRAGSEGAR